MKRIVLAILGGLVAVVVTAMANAPAGVMSMTQEERAAAATARKAAEAQARNDRAARLLCAQRLAIPHNNDWVVEVKGGKYLVQGGMCRIARELVE